MNHRGKEYMFLSGYSLLLSGISGGILDILVHDASI